MGTVASAGKAVKSVWRPFRRKVRKSGRRKTCRMESMGNEGSEDG